MSDVTVIIGVDFGKEPAVVVITGSGGESVKVDGELTLARLKATLARKLGVDEIAGAPFPDALKVNVPREGLYRRFLRWLRRA